MGPYRCPRLSVLLLIFHRRTRAFGRAAVLVSRRGHAARRGAPTAGEIRHPTERCARPRERPPPPVRPHCRRPWSTRSSAAAVRPGRDVDGVVRHVRAARRRVSRSAGPPVLHAAQRVPVRRSTGGAPPSPTLRPDHDLGFRWWTVWGFGIDRPSDTSFGEISPLWWRAFGLNWSMYACVNRSPDGRGIWQQRAARGQPR